MTTERADYVKVDLSYQNPFGMTFYAHDKNRSLFIEEPKSFGSGTPKEAQDLLRTVLLAHLTSKHFPKVIETNFIVENQEFLDRLYNHYGYGKPRIQKGLSQVEIKYLGRAEKENEKIPFVNAHSGGLDSVYRVAKILAQDKKIITTHIRNLNQKGANREAEASREQAKAFGIPYQEIRLRNGSEGGFGVMRTRDMLIGLISAMVAENYKSKKILVEGDMQTSPDSNFSENAAAWSFFNNLIDEVGLHSQVEGMDAHDIETIGEVLKLEKQLGVDIIPLVQNCFTGEFQMRNNRQKWERETPHIAEASSYHWCGSCIKCRRMTLGRLFYNDPKFSKVPLAEIKYFIEDTKKWIIDYPNNSHLITESFLGHLEKLEKRT